MRCCAARVAVCPRRNTSQLPALLPAHSAILSMPSFPPHFVVIVPELRVAEAIPLTVHERPLHHPCHQSHRRTVDLGRSATNLAAVQIIVMLIAVGRRWSI